MNIALATTQDIDAWMVLVNQVKDGFPGLETGEALAEHRNTVLGFMENGFAICAKADNRIVGALLFSKDTDSLCFLAVDADYRRQHIAENMVTYMLDLMDTASAITVTTYRTDVPEGIPAREFYKKMGFVEGKLTEEFGSPVQEFVLKR